MSERPDEEPLLGVKVVSAEAKSKSNNHKAFKDLETRVITNSVSNEAYSKPDFSEDDLSKLLLLALEGKNEFSKVTITTIKNLIKNLSHLNYIDRKWYGWDALHCAAYSANPEKVQIICTKLPRENINSLTMLSENALHILLQHSKPTQTCNLTCKNGQDLKMFRIINEEHKNMVKCVRILIEAGININHTNFWSETPLLIAIKRRYHSITDLLVKQQGIDLDNIDPISGKTPRELLKRKIPETPVVKSHIEILFQLLKSGNEEGFVKYSGGKIREFLKKSDFDSDNVENSSCTLLQYCFRRGLIFWLQDCKSFDNEFYVRSPDITTNRMVDIFCRKGMARSIQHLLENGADPDFSLKRFEGGNTLLEAAIIKGYFPVVALILEYKQNKLEEALLDKISEALVKLLNSEVRSINLNNTLSVVLTKLHEVSLKNTQKMSEVLQHHKKINRENQLLLLKFPGSFTWRNEKSILEDLDPEILQTHLEECVENTGSETKIHIDSFLLDESVLPLLQTFQSSNRLQNFLNHPIFKILIMRHWEHLRFQWSWCKWKYFYLNFFFYVVFYSLLNCYVVAKFNNFWLMDLWFWPGVVCLGIFVIKELVQIVADWDLYRKEMSNAFELLFMIFVIFVYSSRAHWNDAIDVLAVLFSNLVLLFLLINLPNYTKYIIILRTIRTYLRYWLFYFIQFFAFAICFYILFAEENQIWYEDLPNMIFNSIILFTGNLDYMETPWKQNNTTMLLYHNFPSKNLFSKIVFLYFVIFMAIILQNLLLGLLVVDIDKIQKEAELSKQIKKVGFINRVDKFLQKFPIKFIEKIIFDYKPMKLKKVLVLEKNDWKTLNKEEIVSLQFSKNVERVNVLRKLSNYIRKKTNESNYCEVKNESNKLVEKMEIIEDVIKNFMHNK